MSRSPLSLRLFVTQHLSTYRRQEGSCCQQRLRDSLARRSCRNCEQRRANCKKNSGTWQKSLKAHLRHPHGLKFAYCIFHGIEKTSAHLPQTSMPARHVGGSSTPSSQSAGCSDRFFVGSSGEKWETRVSADESSLLGGHRRPVGET